MADEGFHEIQLHGKHVVALFIGAAVVLVVTFLCGVLVGRGVRAQKDATAPEAAVAQPAEPPAADVAAGVQPPASTPQPGSQAAQTSAQPPAAPPAPAEEELSYYSRLESQATPAQAAKPAVRQEEPEQRPSAKPAAKPAVESQAKAPTATPVTQAASGQEPAGEGFALKVGAYTDRSVADGLAARLSRKGYNTYVVPLSGKGLFSVRVGKFKTRKEADETRRRLVKEEQLKPLLTR